MAWSIRTTIERVRPGLWIQFQHAQDLGLSQRPNSAGNQWDFAPQRAYLFIYVYIYIYTVYYVCIRRLIDFPFNQFLAKMITSEAMLIP